MPPSGYMYKLDLAELTAGNWKDNGFEYKCLNTIQLMI